MRSRGVFCVVSLLAALFVPDWGSPACGADPRAMLQQTHPWGRSSKGAWRQVQIITENFDEQGKPTTSTTTDNKTTVEEVTPERVTLKVEVTIEVSGQQIPSQPQIVKQGYAGENFGQSVTIKPLGTETLVIEGREIACETHQLEIVGGMSKESAILSYAPSPAQRLLKRKSVTTDVASGKTTQETITEVYSLDKPIRVLDEIKTGYSVRVVQKNEHGVTTTWSEQVPEIPGEVVFQSSKKLDDQGRLVRRSTLELTGYGTDGGEKSFEGSRRMRRAKRGR